MIFKDIKGITKDFIIYREIIYRKVEDFYFTKGSKKTNLSIYCFMNN